MRPRATKCQGVAPPRSQARRREPRAPGAARQATPRGAAAPRRVLPRLSGQPALQRCLSFFGAPRQRRLRRVRGRPCEEE